MRISNEYLRAIALVGLGLCAYVEIASAQEKHVHGGPYAKMGDQACTTADLHCARSATPLFAPDGSLWLAWNGGGAVSVAKSHDLGKTFDPAVVVARHDSFLDTGPDARPQLAADSKGTLYLAYAFFKDTKYNAQINLATSSDGGRTFSTPVPLSTDAASQRFPSLAVAPGDKVFLAWVDKRLVAAAKQSGLEKSGGSIAYAWSTDGGKHFSEQRIVHEDSCECCRIGVALTPNGMPALAYRAIYGKNVRDHATQVFASDNRAEPAKRVSVDDWATDACPHHGPAIAVSSAGTLHVAWFTQGTARAGLFYARSTNRGNVYTAPRQLGSPDALAGRPTVLALGTRVWLAWKEFDGKQASILVERSDDDGKTWSKPSVVSKAAGYTDHPLLTHSGDQVYLSWQTQDSGYQLLPVGGAE